MEDQLSILKAEIARKRKEIDGSADQPTVKQSKKLESSSPVEDLVIDTSETESQKHNEDISEDELNRRLRAHGKPIWFYGETKKDRIGRLLKLDENNITSSTSTKDENKTAPASLNQQQPGKQDKLISVINENKKDFEKISKSYMKSQKDHCYSLMYLYIKYLLIEWEKYLEEIEEPQVRSKEAHIYQQAAENIKPLFKMLKKKDLDSDIEESLAYIFRFTQSQEYVKANDAYLRMSIGNAAWPIGVSAVGIHERQSRDKITQSKVAHVLNDEFQRKWIQSVKRLITFAQKRWPPADPTKMIG